MDQVVLGTSISSVAIEVSMALGAFFVGALATAGYMRVVAGKNAAKVAEPAPAGPAESAANNAERSCMAAQQLRDLAHTVASDVDAHNTLIGAISSQLGGLINVADARSGAVVMESVAKLLAANGKLQVRLEDAERKIKVQADEIRNQQTEARTDALTKLANRRAFDTALDDSLSKFSQFGRSFSVLILDVDHFKRFNDAHGHQAGDEVLRCVGRTLTRTVKAGDLACRYGGEEFAVVLSNTKIAEAQIACERIRKAIEGMTVLFDHRTLKVTASIGVAEIREHEDGVQLVRRADDAVYASKKSGRNCIHWHNGDESVPAGETKRPAASTALDATGHEVRPVLTPSAAPEAGRLPDRAAFADELRRRVAESQRFGAPLSILYFRVRDFHRLELNYGTAVGGLLVDSVAMFIRSTLRDMDLLAKLDGGDLVVMLPGSTGSAAKIVGQRIKASISHCPIPLGSQHIRLGLEVGVSCAAADDDDASMMAAAIESLEASQQAAASTEPAAEMASV